MAAVRSGRPCGADRAVTSRTIAVVCLLALLGACATAPVVSSEPTSEVPPVSPESTRRDDAPFGPSEMRGTWMVASMSKDGGRRGDELARLRGNAAFFQARSRGDAWFDSAIEPIATPGGDPLGACIAASRGDYDVHAWINMNLVADASRLPTDPRHLVRTHPEWLCVPDAVVAGLRGRTPDSPDYVSAIATHCASRKNEFEGLFADPAHPDYRAHVVRIVEDLARRYAVRGVHFDYIRYASTGSGLSRRGMSEFEARIDAEIDAASKRELAGRRKSDPLAYARRFPKAYAAFRRESVTRLVEEASAAARRARPGLLVSAAVFPDIDDARDRRHQDWPSWLAAGTVDAVAPMLYMKDARDYERRLRAAVAVKGSGRVWAGIGAWLLGPEATAERIELVRRCGADGWVLFSHHALLAMPNAADVLRDGPLRLRSRPPE